MKNLILIICLFISSPNMFAQSSSIKAGANFNADIADHKLGKLNYMSYELSYEKMLAKRWSFDIDYNFSILNHYRTFDDFALNSPYGYGGNYRWEDFNHALILNGRYYFKNNGEGLFFQIGIPITLDVEKDYFISSNGQSSMKSTSTNHFLAISTIAGGGIKYHFNSKCGVEMSINVSPSLNFLDVDYGTSGFVKTGLKFFWLMDSKK